MKALSRRRPTYLEMIREKFLVTTEGTEIKEDLVTTRLGASITSKDGASFRMFEWVSEKSGVRDLRAQEDEFEKKPPSP